ncbi:hypothetical protein HGRIS_003801 [Hohenbuehelia grisea]|uniref:Uncharacterized protein n=1 Tax=Hohenbuehelia grisea TaxID=104357 RepID=A0ABR3JGG9_9AGAR
MDTSTASRKPLKSMESANELFRPHISPWRLIPVVIMYHCAAGIVDITATLSIFRACRAQMNSLPDECTIFSQTVNIHSVTQAVILSQITMNTLTTGFWTRFGDIYGRRSVLIVCVSTPIVQYIIAILGNTEFLAPYAFPLSMLATVVDGIAGGGATFTAVTLAFSNDFVSPKWRVSWFALLRGLDSLCTMIRMFSLGLKSTFGLHHNGEDTRPAILLNLTIGFVVSVLATALAAFLLPERTAAPAARAREGYQRPSHPRGLAKQLLSGFTSMVTVFNPETERSGPKMWMFGLGVLTFSLASTVSGKQLGYTLGGFGSFHIPFVRLVGYTAIFGIPLAYLILIPAVTLLFNSKPRITLADDFEAKARPIVRLNIGIVFGSILVDSLGFAVAEFAGRPSKVFASSLYLVTSLLKAASEPAVFALGATYLDILGQASETGTLFGALAVIKELGTLAMILTTGIFLPTEGSQTPGPASSWVLKLTGGALWLAGALILASNYLRRESIKSRGPSQKRI